MLRDALLLLLLLLLLLCKLLRVVLLRASVAALQLRADERRLALRVGRELRAGRAAQQRRHVGLRAQQQARRQERKAVRPQQRVALLGRHVRIRHRGRRAVWTLPTSADASQRLLGTDPPPPPHPTVSAGAYRGRLRLCARLKLSP